MRVKANVDRVKNSVWDTFKYWENTSHEFINGFAYLFQPAMKKDKEVAADVSDAPDISEEIDESPRKKRSRSKTK
jgi:hypothetical protein